MENKTKRIILIVILITSLLLIGFENIGVLTGKAISTTSSDVTINQFIAMSFSADLQNGIVFEEINFLPSINTDAEKNYDINNKTGYYVIISSDGSSQMDLCIKTSGDLFTPTFDSIAKENETYSYSINSNETLPSILNETSLTFEYVTAGSNMPPGTQNNLRFWLDVPEGQAQGTYSNLIYLRGVTSGDGC